MLSPLGQAAFYRRAKFLRPEPGTASQKARIPLAERFQPMDVRRVFMIYLDHAATTPVPRAVADEMYRVLTEEYGNPSSQYPLGRQAAAEVARGRQVVARA